MAVQVSGKKIRFIDTGPMLNLSSEQKILLDNFELHITGSRNLIQ